jgi:hypothetical protein
MMLRLLVDTGLTPRPFVCGTPTPGPVGPTVPAMPAMPAMPRFPL